jgi:tRNA1Val (adenine37-N6)-methyltransferase
MSNAYFAFKQFIVHQDRCAMKVSTDACIQGAWTPVPQGAKRVLDIGAGTGLLSLMIAQRAPGVHIDAIELDAAAAEQAAENVAGSPFSAQIDVRQGDATALQPSKPYDLIICNPPFFRNSLQGPDAARRAARHGRSLNAGSIVTLILAHLAPGGAACLMWPQSEQEAFRLQARSQGLYLRSRLLVRDRAGSRINRAIGMYGLQAAEPEDHELVIKQADGSYTSDFTRMLAPFYLHL